MLFFICNACSRKWVPRIDQPKKCRKCGKLYTWINDECSDITIEKAVSVMKEKKSKQVEQQPIVEEIKQDGQIINQSEQIQSQ